LPASGGQLDIGRTGDHRVGWLWLQLAVVIVTGLLAVPVVGRRPDEDRANPSEVAP
jgi:hypothetical protein